jgi:WD40 repeat protein
MVFSLPGDATFVAFAPVGRRWAISFGQSLPNSVPRVVKVFESVGGEEILSLPDVGSRSVFSADGQTLAVRHGKDISVWNLLQKRETGRIRDVGSARFVFSPDARHLASGHDSGDVRLWDADSGQRIGSFSGHGARVWRLAFSPDGNLLATASSDRTARLWDVATRRQTAQLRGHESEVWAVAFSPDGKTLATGSKDETIRFWSTTPAIRSEVLAQGRLDFYSVPVFSRDGQRLTVQVNEEATCWDIRLRKELSHLAITGSLLGPPADDESLVTLARDQPEKRWVLKLYPLSSNRTPAVIPLSSPLRTLSAVRLSPDGRAVAVGQKDGVIAVADVVTGRTLHTWQGHTMLIWQLAFSADGQMLAAVSQDRTASLWSLARGQNLAILRNHKDSVTCVAFSPSAETLATGSADATIKLWHVPTQSELATLLGHKEGLSRVAFSPDGRTLASSSSDDGTVRFWHVATRREIGAFPIKRVVHLAFSPDNQSLMLGCEDGSLHLWRAPTLEEIDRIDEVRDAPPPVP